MVINRSATVSVCATSIQPVYNQYTNSIEPVYKQYRTSIQTVYNQYPVYNQYTTSMQSVLTQFITHCSWLLGPTGQLEASKRGKQLHRDSGGLCLARQRLVAINVPVCIVTLCTRSRK